MSSPTACTVYWDGDGVTTFASFGERNNHYCLLTLYFLCEVGDEAGDQGMYALYKPPKGPYLSCWLSSTLQLPMDIVSASNNNLLASEFSTFEREQH